MITQSEGRNLLINGKKTALLSKLGLIYIAFPTFAISVRQIGNLPTETLRSLHIRLPSDFLSRWTPLSSATPGHFLVLGQQAQHIRSLPVGGTPLSDHWHEEEGHLELPPHIHRPRQLFPPLGDTGH